MDAHSKGWELLGDKQGQTYKQFKKLSSTMTKETTPFLEKIQKQQSSSSVHVSTDSIPTQIVNDELDDYEDAIPVFKSVVQVATPFYDSSDENHKKQWAWAKQKQNEILEKTDKIAFKIRAKDVSKNEAQAFGFVDTLKNDFISIQSEEDRSSKLYCLASRGNHLDKGNFGKVKLAMDEDGNVVAVKIIFRIKEKTQVCIAKTQDELFELDLEKTMGISKGGFSRVSETKKDINSNKVALGENKVIEKEYQVKEFLGKSLKGVLKDIQAGKTPDFTPKEKIEIGIKLIEAVKNMHDLNIIHRDLHAGNVMILRDNNGQLKVSIIDFGLAVRVKDKDSAYVQDKSRVYNLGLLTPEQETKVNSEGRIVAKIGTKFNRATDLYCMGKILKDNLGLHLDLSVLAPNPQARDPEKDIIHLRSYTFPSNNSLSRASFSTDNYAVFESEANQSISTENYAPADSLKPSKPNTSSEIRKAFVPAREGLKNDAAKDNDKAQHPVAKKTDNKPQSKI